MARPTTFKNSRVVSLRIESDEYENIKQIASLQSTYSGRLVTANDLIRDACRFVYEDGEQLRESYRRSREHINKRMSKSYEK